MVKKILIYDKYFSRFCKKCVIFGDFRKIYEKYHLFSSNSKSICRRSKNLSPFLSAFYSAKNEYNIDEIGEL